MLAALTAAAALTCSGFDTPARDVVDAQALLMLRDISGLSLSPDGARAAFQLQQADLDTDGYSSVWCVIDLGGGQVRTLGDGGDILMPILPGRERRTGMWMTLAPRWSPDGERIAFLARRGEETQIEVCDTNGARCRRVTSSAGDVEDFVWSADGAGFIFRASYPRDAARTALAREGDSGFRLDDRFDIFHAFHPLRAAEPRPSALRYADLADGRERAATRAEIARFETIRRAPISTTMGTGRSVSLFSNAPVAQPAFLASRDVRDFVRFGSGAIWTEPAEAALAGAAPPLALWIRRDGTARPHRCRAEACTGRIVEFAPTPDGRAVLFIRREGWGESVHGLYLWTLEDDAVRLVRRGDDVVRVCAPRANNAICLREGPTRPRAIVTVDYTTGDLRTIFDANPELADDAFAPARKLEWTTPLGDEVFGYLLTPPGQEGPWPLIVVQYRASGFLRGGVGDEYPIQAFVRRGFAVLALERPDPFALRARVRDGAEIDRREWQGLAERRRTLAALTSGIDRLVEMGVADRTRVGVTGLSDGAETAVFALIHCGCIAAAAISSGVHDPSSLYFASDGERLNMRAGGRGEPGRAEGALWPELSLSLNAERVRAPILAQVADRELLFMLQAHRTFTDLSRPFDLYVFPDEYHVKWRPRHRRAIYARSLDWFAFWLLGEEDGDPNKRDQYRRWRTWRAALPAPR
jgi:dipeptidyl aminopeptidase/acylaminoacyl peptidase